MSEASLPPSVARLLAVARALGDLRERVVFIGGAVAPLLQTEPPFPRVRPTRDVDAVAAATSLSGVDRLHEALRARGFRPDPHPPAHAHRWVLATDDASTERIPFDLVPVGSALGASSNQWDEMAIDTAVERTIDGVTFRHASAPGFLALKWAAYRDRGAADPLMSHDLEDFLALVAARPTIVEEIGVSPVPLVDVLRGASAAILGDLDAAEILDAHLNNAVERAATVRLVRERLTAIADR